MKLFNSILDYMGVIIIAPPYWSMEEKRLHTAVVYFSFIFGFIVGLFFRSQIKSKKKRFLIWGCLALLLLSGIIYFLIFNIVGLFIEKVILSALIAISLGFAGGILSIGTQ